MSKIVRLEAENFKRLRAVTIRPDGTLVEIRGANGAGKSSCLDAIAAALGGARLCPEVPIRQGQKTARVTVELDDGLTVERRWTKSGTTLAIKAKDGAKYDSPQKILDGMIGKLTFDPLVFMRELPERQAEILRQLIGVDFSLLDNRRKGLFDSRTDVNRRVAAAKARLSAIPEIDAPDELVSAAALMEEQGRRQAGHAALERKRLDLTQARNDYRTATDTVADALAHIQETKERLVRAEAAHAKAIGEQARIQAIGETLRNEVESLVGPDLEEIPAQLRELEAVNERIRAKRARAEQADQLEAAETEAKQLTASIEEVDQQKEAALAGAVFPVPGIGFGEKGVTLNGLPLEQASSAEQLRVSVAMSIALNPKLRVMSLRDGSLLDERSLALIADMAEKSDTQVWIEMVSTESGTGIVIEDGQVEGAAPAEAANG